MLNLHVFGIIVLNAILMGALSLFTVWTFYTYQSWGLISFPLSLLAGQMLGLTYYLNRRNRQLAQFFASIDQQDTAISFPTEVKDRSQRLLHTQLNRVNQILQDIKLKHSAQEHYYRILLDQAGAGILVIDEQGNIPTINQRALKLMGRQSLRHQDQLKAVDVHFHQTIRDATSGEKRLIALQNNERVKQLIVNTTHLVNLGQSFRVITLQDIRNELDQQELDAWIRLIRVITHEIANTTGPLISLSRSMQERIRQLPANDNSHFLDEALTIITERSEGLASFVSSYRKLMKVPLPVLQPIKATAVIDKIRILMSALLKEEQVTLNADVHPSDLTILIDEGLFSQALLNLIKNALEALRGSEMGLIEIGVRTDTAGKVIWKITDNGPGLPAEHMDDIFVPFFTNKVEGSGIGLSLARQILRLHGGSLTGQNQPEGGAVFRMIIPHGATQVTT